MLCVWIVGSLDWDPVYSCLYTTFVNLGTQSSSFTGQAQGKGERNGRCSGSTRRIGNASIHIC